MGNLLKGQTVGIIGAGRIGTAYARMMVGPTGQTFRHAFLDLHIYTCASACTLTLPCRLCSFPLILVDHGLSDVFS